MDRSVFASLITERLKEAGLADQWALTRYGTPTRYAVIDDLLPVELADVIAQAFPDNDMHFTARASFRERKRTSTRFDALPSVLEEITFAFQLPEVAGLIAANLGIEGMSGDPTLYAGGLSVMRKGDFLNPHIDNSHEASRTRYRRVNLLYYVTPDFPDNVGGNLELWDQAVSQPVTIHSRFNRLVIMETNRYSWHSVSAVQTNLARRCVSNYYFSPASPDGSEYFHITSFSARPEQRVRRILAGIDSAARTIAGQMGLGRGKRYAYAFGHVPTDKHLKCEGRAQGYDKECPLKAIRENAKSPSAFE